jgi:signal transduction histidine kinase
MLLVVLGVAVIPLGLVGLWLTNSAARSGEELLRGRLDDALDQTVSEIVSRWIAQRSALLFLTEEPGMLQALEAEPADIGAPRELVALFDGLGPGVLRASILDRDHQERWHLERDAGGLAPLEAGFPPATLTVRLDVRHRRSGELLGALDADLRVEALLPVGGVGRTAGMVVGLFDVDGIPLVPTPVAPPLLAGEGFRWGGDDWLTAARTLTDPPVRVVVAAPLTPFAEPFQQASQRGVWLLLGVALAAVGGAGLLLGRLTRSLRHLSEAAEAVSRGELGRRVEVEGADELGRVADAFNTMTDSLERTLDRLSNRESLAAVGEFAASLAHEVRNPLTAIRLDLQRVEEALPTDFGLREEHERALAEVERLNDTVSTALAAARTGGAQDAKVDLRSPIQAAARAAAPAFAEHEAALTVHMGDEPTSVNGDTGALEQLFLNLLQNSAEALKAGDEAAVTLSEEGGHAVVVVTDSGPGVAQENLGRIFEPLFTTRPEGTGLGLTVARRIAMAHGGTLDLKNQDGGGARAVVQLPLSARDTAAAATPGLSRPEEEM